MTDQRVLNPRFGTADDLKDLVAALHARDMYVLASIPPSLRSLTRGPARCRAPQVHHGREGYYHLGIPPSGALDQYALSAANHLVGNPIGAAGLECTLIGPELLFQQDALVALSGALMAPRLDGDVVACLQIGRAHV